jgi:hypothetical protein
VKEAAAAALAAALHTASASSGRHQSFLKILKFRTHVPMYFSYFHTLPLSYKHDAARETLQIFLLRTTRLQGTKFSSATAELHCKKYSQRSITAVQYSSSRKYADIFVRP